MFANFAVHFGQNPRCEYPSVSRTLFRLKNGVQIFADYITLCRGLVPPVTRQFVVPPRSRSAPWPSAPLCVSAPWSCHPFHPGRLARHGQRLPLRSRPVERRLVPLVPGLDQCQANRRALCQADRGQIPPHWPRQQFKGQQPKPLQSTKHPAFSPTPVVFHQAPARTTMDAAMVPSPHRDSAASLTLALVRVGHLTPQ